MTQTMRAVFFGGAVALAGFTAFSPFVRDPFAFPNSRAAFFFSVVVALVVLGATTGRAGERSGRWAALALVGWAAHLQLIVAGPRPAYQHFDLLTASQDPFLLLPLGILVAETSIAFWTLARLGSGVFSQVDVRFPRVGLGVALLFLFGLAAVPSAAASTYATELVVAFLLQIVHLATAGLSVRALPASVMIRLDDWLERREISAFPGFAWGAAAFTTLTAIVFCLWVYENHPHVPDEIAYLLPARYFAALRLELALPPVPDGFAVDLVYNDGLRWYSPVPPGWPAVLALGVLVGAPWIVNPVLGGVSVLLTWRLTSSLCGPRTARLSTLLLASSPWLIFLSMSFMPHALTLACGLFAAVSVDVARKKNAAWPTLWGGAAIGLAALTRPLDAVAIALITGTWALTVRAGRFRLGAAAGLTLASVVVAAITLPYNRHFTGSSTTFPLMAYTDAMYGPGTNAMGFGQDRGLGWTGLDPFPGHGPIDVVVNAMLNASAINIELLGWSAGSLLMVALSFARWRPNRVDWVWVASIACVVFLHSFYWFSGGPDFGARYWFLTIVPLVILTARGTAVLDGRVQSGPNRRARFAVLALGLSLMSVAAFLPWRTLDKYHGYRRMDPGILTLAEQAHFGSGLVLVRGSQHPDYGSAAIYNPLDWTADQTIYAWDHSPEVRRSILEAYPSRNVWVVDGPSTTGYGYRVVEGPIPPGPAREHLFR